MSYLILVVDDEQSICQALTGILSDEGYEVITAFNASQAIKKVNEELPDLVLLDIWLPDIDGLTVLKEIKKQYPQLPVVMISGHGNVETAVKAMKLGAYDFIEKPLSWENTIPPIVNALKMSSLQEENIALKQKAFFKCELTGQSEPIKVVKEQIRKVAPTNASVLIKGESGTGKEFVRKKGKFDLANGGTIFLDEIGDMSPKTQAKILRLIQEQRFERVGGIKTVQVDVRVVAATNKNLEEEIKKGNFRADLYYRLNVVPIEIPPLRERKEDIPLLVEEFLQEMAKESSLGLKKITPEAIEVLKQYDWPGNVRELKNIIERLVIMTPGEVITVKDIPESIAQGKEHIGMDFFKADNFREAKAIFEKEFLRKKLEKYKGNVSLTAQAIGLERSHLHKKMKTYGL